MQHQSSQSKSNDLETGIYEANFQLALKQRNQISNKYYKGQEVDNFAQLSHFKIYGPGIYLFFSFLKHASIVFLVLTLISIPPIIYNGVKGPSFLNKSVDLTVILAKSSIGGHSIDLMPGDDYSQSIKYKIFNVSFDLLACAIFLGFIIYWEKKSKTIEKHIQKQIKLQSSFTVQVTEFPSKVSERQIKEFMGRFGTVTEIVPVRDYTKEIEISKQIFEKEMEIKQLQFEDKQNVNHNNREQIWKLKEQEEQLYKQLDSLENRTNQIVSFYVQYATVQQRKAVMRKFNQYQFISKCLQCWKKRPQNMLLKGQKIYIQACDVQPNGIIWQNAHYTWKHRWWRATIQLILILAIIVGGFLLICYINVQQPPVNSDTNTDGLTYQDIKKNATQDQKQSWCIKQYSIIANESLYEKTCSMYWKRYTISIIMSFGIAFVTQVFCEIIKKILYALAAFQKYKTVTQKILNLTTNLFIMEFITSTIITFLMQANIFGLSILSFLKKIVTTPQIRENIDSIDQYKDLSSDWYNDIGYQIWFNILMMCAFPQVYEPFLMYLQEKWQFFWAKREIIHKKMVQELIPPEFEIQDEYANILMLIATGFIFGGGIQLMIVVVFICLAVRFFYLKYKFIRFCKVPIIYNSALNERVILILKIVLPLRCMISIYMYGADGVFAMQKSTFMKWAINLSLPVVRSVFIIISRALLTWYYTIFFIVFLIILLFGAQIANLLRRLRKWLVKDKSEKIKVMDKTADKIVNNEFVNSRNEEIQSRRNDENSLQSWISNDQTEMKSQRVSIKSYKLQNNPQYTQILVIMNQKSKKKKQFVESLQQN